MFYHQFMVFSTVLLALRLLEIFRSPFSGGAGRTSIQTKSIHLRIGRTRWGLSWLSKRWETDSDMQS